MRGKECLGESINRELFVGNEEEGERAAAPVKKGGEGLS